LFNGSPTAGKGSLSNLEADLLLPERADKSMINLYIALFISEYSTLYWIFLVYVLKMILKHISVLPGRRGRTHSFATALLGIWRE